MKCLKAFEKYDSKSLWYNVEIRGDKINEHKLGREKNIIRLVLMFIREEGAMNEKQAFNQAGETCS